MRVVDTGFVGRLLVSHRPCYDCPKCLEHKFRKCSGSEETRTFEIDVEPVGEPLNTVNVTRGFLALEAESICNDAQTGDVLAVETESNDDVYWLVKVVRKGACP